MLNRSIIANNLEICQSQIILQLCVISLQSTRLLKGLQRLRIIAHLVKGHSQIKVTFGSAAIHCLQVVDGGDLQLLPLGSLYYLMDICLKFYLYPLVLTLETGLLLPWLSSTFLCLSAHLGPFAASFRRHIHRFISITIKIFAIQLWCAGRLRCYFIVV